MRNECIQMENENTLDFHLCAKNEGSIRPLNCVTFLLLLSRNQTLIKYKLIKNCGTQKMFGPIKIT